MLNVLAGTLSSMSGASFFCAAFSLFMGYSSSMVSNLLILCLKSCNLFLAEVYPLLLYFEAD